MILEIIVFAFLRDQKPFQTPIVYQVQQNT